MPSPCSGRSGRRDRRRSTGTSRSEPEAHVPAIAHREPRRDRDPRRPDRPRDGLHCIGVYSEADRTALHRTAMDESVEIGGPLPVQSYLNASAILRAARETRADAIHPGYGFLSEKADFAVRCAEAGIVFVGPPPE